MSLRIPAHCPECANIISAKGQQTKLGENYLCPSCRVEWTELDNAAMMATRACELLAEVHSGNTYRQQANAASASAYALLAINDNLVRIANALEGRQT
jgi:hypothetical protein